MECGCTRVCCLPCTCDGSQVNKKGSIKSAPVLWLDVGPETEEVGSS